MGETFEQRRDRERAERRNMGAGFVWMGIFIQASILIIPERWSLGFGIAFVAGMIGYFVGERYNFRIWDWIYEQAFLRAARRG